jgi:hypothetical protein
MRSKNGNELLMFHESYPHTFLQKAQQTEREIEEELVENLSEMSNESS